MKKLNKKGFTLVELLVVLVILAVIMSIAIPSVTSSIERSKQKQKDAKIELIVSAAELYVDRHKNTFIDNNIYNIYISLLFCDRLLTQEEAKDPFNEKSTLSGYVVYNNEENTYNWIESDCEGCYEIIVEDFKPHNYCPR